MLSLALEKCLRVHRMNNWVFVELKLYEENSNLRPK